MIVHRHAKRQNTACLFDPRRIGTSLFFLPFLSSLSSTMSRAQGRPQITPPSSYTLSPSNIKCASSGLYPSSLSATLFMNSFLDLYEAGLIVLDQDRPSRTSLWDRKHCMYYIDSIIQYYPLGHLLFGETLLMPCHLHGVLAMSSDLPAPSHRNVLRTGRNLQEILLRWSRTYKSHT